MTAQLPVLANAAVKTPPVREMAPTVLPARAQLSTVLKSYGAANGWSIEWEAGEDYVLDDDLRLPGHSVIADVQFLLRTYQARRTLLGVGIDVDSNTRSIKIRNKPGAAPSGDPAVEMRLSTGVFTPDQLSSTRSSLAPIPVAVNLQPIPSSALAIGAADYRSMAVKMPPISMPARDVRANATLRAARDADRELARQTVAMWERRVAEQSSPDGNEIAQLLPPPALVVGRAAPSTGAMALAAELPPSHELPTAVPTPVLASATTLRPRPLPRPAAAVTPSLKTPKADIATNAAVGAHSEAAVVANATPGPSTPPLPVTAEQSAPIPTVEPVKAAVEEKTWVAHNGDTLKDTISTWASQQNWVLVWNDKRPDLEVVGNVEVQGDLVDAVTYLFDVYRRSGARFAVDVYTKQQLILVKEQ